MGTQGPAPAVRGAHTPGPWIFGRTSDDKRLILGGKYEKYVATVTVHQIPRHMGLHDEPEREANAHLITAAPDYDALLVEALDLVPRIDDNDPMATTLLDWCRRVRAAIARAHGEGR